MIDINKKYRTRDGHEVRIYATDGYGPYSVHGAVEPKTGVWILESWTTNGKTSCEVDGSSDLVEAKPRIKRKCFMNIHKDDGLISWGHKTKEQADQNSGPARIACVEIEIDCEEGEGL